MTWYQLFESAEEALAQIPPQKAVTVQIGTKRLCLARVGDRFFALQDACPHSGAPLSKGHVNEGGEVVCPLHAYRYRLLDGVEAYERSSAAKNYPVELRDEGIFIGI